MQMILYYHNKIAGDHQLKKRN